MLCSWAGVLPGGARCCIKTISYIKRLEVLARRSRLYWRVQNPCNVSMWTGMWSRYLSRWSAKLWLGAGAGGGDHGNSYGSLLSSSWLWLLSIISQQANTPPVKCSSSIETKISTETVRLFCSQGQDTAAIWNMQLIPGEFLSPRPSNVILMCSKVWWTQHTTADRRDQRAAVSCPHVNCPAYV